MDFLANTDISLKGRRLGFSDKVRGRIGILFMEDISSLSLLLLLSRDKIFLLNVSLMSGCVCCVWSGDGDDDDDRGGESDMSSSSFDIPIISYLSGGKGLNSCRPYLNGDRKAELELELSVGIAVMLLLLCVFSVCEWSWVEMLDCWGPSEEGAVTLDSSIEGLTPIILRRNLSDSNALLCGREDGGDRLSSSTCTVSIAAEVEGSGRDMSGIRILLSGLSKSGSEEKISS